MVCLVTESALQGGLNMQQPVKLTPTLLSLARNTAGDEQLCSMSDQLTRLFSIVLVLGAVQVVQEGGRQTRALPSVSWLLRGHESKNS